MDYEIGADERVSSAVVRAVSAVVGREPCSIPPLVEVIDPEALDALFDSRISGEQRTGGQVSFVYGDCRVTVDNAEYLTVQPIVVQSRTADAGARERPDAE